MSTTERDIDWYDLDEKYSKVALVSQYNVLEMKMAYRLNEEKWNKVYHVLTAAIMVVVVALVDSGH